MTKSSKAEIKEDVVNILNHVTETLFYFFEEKTLAFLLALKSKSNIGKIVNIGSNFEISIANVAKTILQILESDAELMSEDARIRPSNSEVNRLWADITKIQKVFGWKPTYGLEEGFRLGLIKTIEWYLDDKNLSQYKFNTITY